jgi:hypothetical protein
MQRTRKVVLALAIPALALGLAPVAQADQSDNQWGQDVKSCNASRCYPGGTTRGEYVNGQARDADGPGYGREIHDLAKPGKSDPNGGPLN